MEGDMIQENTPRNLSLSGEEQAKSVNAFVKDSSISVFGKEFIPFFSKHIILSFFNKDEISLMMQLFDNAILSKIVNSDISEEELLKYNQMRIIFFAAVKRAVGKGDNERTLLAKSISESIVAENSMGNSFFQKFFPKRR